MSEQYADVFTGPGYVPGRPFEAIVALVRTDLSAAVTAGAFPVGVTLEAKAGSEPGRLAVVVRGLPAEFAGSGFVSAQVSSFGNAYNRIVRPLYGEGRDQEYRLDILYVESSPPAVAASQIRGHAERWHDYLTEDEHALMRAAQLALVRVGAFLHPVAREDRED